MVILDPHLVQDLFLLIIKIRHFLNCFIGILLCLFSRYLLNFLHIVLVQISVNSLLDPHSLVISRDINNVVDLLKVLSELYQLLGVFNIVGIDLKVHFWDVRDVLKLVSFLRVFWSVVHVYNNSLIKFDFGLESLSVVFGHLLLLEFYQVHISVVFVTSMWLIDEVLGWCEVFDRNVLFHFVVVEKFLMVICQLLDLRVILTIG